MPAIAPTDFAALAVLADRWVRRRERPPTLQLTNEQRRSDPSAAAAFAIKTFQDRPFLESCRCCGRWTGSWCEGCYAVAATNPSWEFSSVCTECDRDRVVCPRCRHHGVSWQSGHDAYESFFQEETAAEVQLEQTADGSWIATSFRPTRTGQERASSETTAPSGGRSPAGPGP